MIHTNTNTEKTLWGIAAFLAAVVLALWLFPNQRSFGQAPPSIAAGFSSSSLVTVGTGLVDGNGGRRILFTANKACTSRIITTYGTAIMLSFSTTTNGAPTSATSSTFLSGLRGHSQLASTTVIYDSGLYGCENVGVYGMGTDTVYITEYQ